MHAPHTDAQWIQTNRPYGGPVNCLAVSGTNLFAGADSGGVFRSADIGDSWTPVNQALTCTRVNALAVVGSALLAGIRGGGVFLSTNSGDSWSPISTALNDSNISCLSANGTTLFAGTSSGLFRSTDNGSIWTVQALKDSPVVALIATGTTIFATWYYHSSPYNQGASVSRSTDNGDTWTVVSEGLWNRHVTAYAASATFVFPGASNMAPYGPCIYCSSDDGTSWITVHESDGEGKWDYGIVNGLAITDRVIFAATDGSMFRSMDNGDNWTPANEGLSDSSVLAVAVLPPITCLLE